MAVRLGCRALGVALALVFLSAPPAGASRPGPAGTTFIYWTNSGNDTIGRANIDGSGVNQTFIYDPLGGRPGPLAIDSSQLYWGTPTGIDRASIYGDGLQSNFIESKAGVGGVAVDGEHIYFTYGEEVGAEKIGNVERAKLDGSGLEPHFITKLDAGVIPGVAVTSGFIYWVNFWDSAVGRANLDGSEVNQYFIQPQPGGTGTPVGIAVDAQHIYWSITYENHIGRANLDGSEFTRGFVTGLGAKENQSVGLATDGEYIYWANPASGTIGRAKLNGTEVNENFITGANEPTGVVVTPPPSVEKEKTPVEKGKPPVEPPPPPPSASIAGVSTAGSSATVMVACNGSPGQVCAGSYGLSVHETKLAGRVVAVAARSRGKHKHKPKPVVVAVSVGSGSYSVAAGSRQRLVVHLNAAGLALLGRFYKLSSTLTFSASSGSSLPSQSLRFSYPRVHAKLDAYSVAAYRASTLIRSWYVGEAPPAGTILVSCHGGGCPYRSRSFSHPRGKVLILKGARLSVGATVQVALSVPNSVGPAVTVTMKSEAEPREVFGCLSPSARAPTACA